jgi:hypothetical protein
MALPKTFTSGERLFASDLNEALEYLDGFTLATETGPQTGNYTLALTDAFRVVAMNPSDAVTVTVPTDASVAFPIGSVVNIYRASSNAVTIAGASGVTVRNAGAIAYQHGEVSLRKRATDEWVLSGQVV